MPRTIATHRCHPSLRVAEAPREAMPAIHNRRRFPSTLQQVPTLVVSDHLQDVAPLQAVGRERVVVFHNTPLVNEACLGWGKAVLIMDEILDCLDGGRGGGVHLVLGTFQVHQHQLEHSRGLRGDTNTEIGR